MKENNKTNFIIVIFLTVLVSMAVCPTTAFAWGDDSGGRPSYSAQYVSEHADDFGSTPFFNSISDAEIGDERDFVSAMEADSNGIAKNPHSKWQGGNIEVENGETYVIRLYVNNNNPNDFDAVAENVRVAFSIPSTSSKQVQVNGFIESSNASPSEYWDYVNLHSEHNFHLEYSYGSAMLYNDGVGQGGITLGDEIVTKVSEGGVLIGYNELDGSIPGGDIYASYITIRVKVVYDDDFTVKTTIRFAGEKEWHESVDAEIGEKVEFQIEYNNTSTETQTNVMIRDILPDNLKYVANTTKLYNSNHPNWATLTPDGDIVTRGVNIGSYLGSADGKSGGNAFVRFTAEVVDSNLEEGINTIENLVWVGVNDTTIEDSVKIIIQHNKRYNTIIAIYTVLIAICLITIIILLLKILRRNKNLKQI